MLNRRQILLGMGVATAGAALPWLLRDVRAGSTQQLYFSAFDDDNGQHHLAILDANAND